MNIGSRIGLLVRVYLKNGHVFQGAVRQWSEQDGILLASPAGELIEILTLSDVSAIVYVEKKDGELVKERPARKESTGEELPSKEEIKKTEEKIEPQHEIGDLTSLVELYKMKAQSEREIAKQKLRSQTCGSGTVEYGNQLSVLRATKNNSGK